MWLSAWLSWSTSHAYTDDSCLSSVPFVTVERANKSPLGLWQRFVFSRRLLFCVHSYMIASGTCYEPLLGLSSFQLWAVLNVSQTSPWYFEPNPFHPLHEFGFREIHPFIPQRGALRLCENRQKLGGTPVASPQSHLLSIISVCRCHCRLPQCKAAVLGCAGELLAVMAEAYVMTPSASHWQEQISTSLLLCECHPLLRWAYFGAPVGRRKCKVIMFQATFNTKHGVYSSKRKKVPEKSEQKKFNLMNATTYI